PAIQRVALVLGLPLLARELVGLLHEARNLLGRICELRIVRDGRLLLLVVLGVERGNRARRVRDCRFELRRFLGEAEEHGTLGRDAIAKLANLALGLEDAARLGLPAAAHEMRAAEVVAVTGGDLP